MSNTGHSLGGVLPLCIEAVGVFYSPSQLGKKNMLFTQSKKQQIDKEPHGRKVMLCVWWDHYSIVHFEFLNHNFLRKFSTHINKRNFVLLQDNARPHSARLMQEKYWIEASLFYSIHHIHQILHQVISIFCFLKNALWWQKYFSRLGENNLWKVSDDFYLRRISKPPDKWQEVIKNNGKYTIELN